MVPADRPLGPGSATGPIGAGTVTATAPGRGWTAAYGITWLLLLSGVRQVLEVGIWSGDAGDLRKLTHVPMFVWFLLWLTATCGAVAAGGAMLVLLSWRAGRRACRATAAECGTLPPGPLHV